MTNEQLTNEVINLREHQAKYDAERENIYNIINEMRTDIKSTKLLAEDVHIMAVNIHNMQKTLQETNEKVDALTNKDFTEYKEGKKLVKNNIISGITGALCTGVIAMIGLAIKTFIEKGGM